MTSLLGISPRAGWSPADVTQEEAVEEPPLAAPPEKTEAAVVNSRRISAGDVSRSDESVLYIYIYIYTHYVYNYIIIYMR